MAKLNGVEKVELYRRLLEEAAQEGNSVIKVAKKHGVSFCTLFRWRKHFGERLTPPPVAPPPDLLPVELTGARDAAPVISVLSIGGPPPEGGFLLKLRSGHEVRVPSGFNVNELRSLVTALEAAPCS